MNLNWKLGLLIRGKSILASEHGKLPNSDYIQDGRQILHKKLIIQHCYVIFEIYFYDFVTRKDVLADKEQRGF